MRLTAPLMAGIAMSLCSSIALANVHDTFGVGARSIGMGNANTAVAVDGSAAYFNPAALGKLKTIELDLGFQMFIPQFDDFENIVYDRNQNGVIDYDTDGTPETTTVGAQYAPTMGMGLNVAIPINSWIVGGVSAYMPTAGLLRLQFEDVYIPYYSLYKNRTQKFSVYAGLGMQIFDGLYVGVGGSVAARLEVRGRISSYTEIATGLTDPETGESLPTEVTTQTNLDALTIQMKSAMAPGAGVLFNFGWIADSLKGLNLAATYRGESSVGTDVEVVTGAAGTVSVADDKIYSGPFTPTPVTVTSEMLSSFNPAQLAMGLSYTLPNEKLMVNLDTTFTQWSAYQETYISQSNQIIIEDLATIDVQVGRDVYLDNGELDPGMAWQDTVTPRFGIEYTGGMPRGADLGFKFTLRGGYGYHRSPVPEQVWNVNMMDSNKHMFSGGIGFKVPMGRLPYPLRVDLFGSYHLLQTRIHTKDPAVAPSETGIYPVGYPLGGSITSEGSLTGFGMTVGMTL